MRLNLTDEDRVVFLRFILGLVYGVVSYIIYRFSFTILFDMNTTVWFFAAVLYAISMPIVEYRYKHKGIFILLGRGLLTYYITWLSILLILYDLLG